MVFPSINERIRQLCETDEFSDVEFIIRNKEQVDTIKGHKNIFSGASEVFKAMFYGHLSEGDKIVIKDVEPNAFISLKRYIYTNEVGFESLYHAKNVYAVADLYNFDELRDKAERYLLANISPETVLSTLEFGKKYRKLNFENRCFDLIRKFTISVLNSEEFLKCDLDFINMIVNEDQLNISEIDLFNSIERWVKFNMEIKDSLFKNVDHLLYEIVNNIRFLAMSTDDFLKGPNKSPLLTIEERFTLLSNIASSGSIPIPDRFCKEKVSRKSYVSASVDHVKDLDNVDNATSGEPVFTSELDVISHFTRCYGLLIQCSARVFYTVLKYIAAFILIIAVIIGLLVTNYDGSFFSTSQSGEVASLKWSKNKMLMLSTNQFYSSSFKLNNYPSSISVGPVIQNANEKYLRIGLEVMCNTNNKIFYLGYHLKIFPVDKEKKPWNTIVKTEKFYCSKMNSLSDLPWDFLITNGYLTDTLQIELDLVMRSSLNSPEPLLPGTSGKYVLY